MPSSRITSPSLVPVGPVNFIRERAPQVWHVHCALAADQCGDGFWTSVQRNWLVLTHLFAATQQARMPKIGTAVTGGVQPSSHSPRLSVRRSDVRFVSWLSLLALWAIGQGQRV